MEKIVQYLNGLDFNILVVILMTLFFSLERLLGSPHKFDKRVPHLLNNMVIQVTFVLMNFAVAAAQVAILQWGDSKQFGLFYHVEAPFWLKLIIGIAVLDLSSYWVHRVSHRSPLLWRLHRVHHSDTSMDSSSYFRGHPFEAWTFGMINVLGAMVLGIDATILTFYFVLLLPILIVEHSNIVLPDWMDRTFGRIFTTPNLHKVHHHRDQYYTDSNYADIFILWDRLFGTYKYVPVKDIRYGLDEFDEPRKQTFWYLLISPFLTIKRVGKADKGNS
jgi:sterol desaturase/sphingolipid hydroxylase (fatty acid hydroxylase superfamily)